MPITIRPMERRDYPAVTEILEQAYKAPPWNARINAEAYRKGMRLAERRKHKIRLVAEQGGRVVGFIDGRLEGHILNELPEKTRNAHQLPRRVFHLYRFFTRPGTPKLVAGKLYLAWEGLRAELAQQARRRDIRNALSTIVSKTHPENAEMLRFFKGKQGKPERFENIHTGPNRKGRELEYFMRKVSATRDA